MGLVRSQLTLAFEGRVPEVLNHLMGEDALLDAHALAFVAGPILPLGHGKVRAFVANPGQPAFASRLQEVLGPATEPLLTHAPAGGRLMVETDGTTHRLFADDLHLHEGADAHVIARTLTLPSGSAGLLSAAPIEAPWAALRARAEDAGLTGLWLAHRTAGVIDHLLVVNEARWTSTPEPQARLLDGLGDRAWGEQRELAAQHGLAAYPDAVEIHPHGWCVTVGLYDPAIPSRRA